MWKWIGAFLLLSVWAVANDHESSVHLNMVHQLDPLIYDVKGMGQWQKGSRKGQIRLVLTRTEKQDGAFIQWVRWNKKGPVSVEYTTQIAELQTEGNFKVTFIRREVLNEHERRMVLGLENKHDKSIQRAYIWVTDMGTYRLEMKR
ncbi:hypothetical protein HF888_09775 [Bermanella marisrubri]|uniref:Transcription elongation factor GreB n=1 Tax=Bermanella marisrubri TaxID=207949 RepID=Q1N674_9GAMM|nr:hypothetical protein [Bermanella marisrubri]EAT13718.1 transcription elongation factor GreB [Oceanobacter sp. RED65] [Bermanella marisrubri]QIZ84494.1 hypothetical protein HF888_09775 [Bermanella marisrubri]